MRSKYCGVFSRQNDWNFFSKLHGCSILDCCLLVDWDINEENKPNLATKATREQNKKGRSPCFAVSCCGFIVEGNTRKAGMKDCECRPSILSQCDVM
jgi:hypothetical protein